MSSSSGAEYVMNPDTQRLIRKGGRTHRRWQRKNPTHDELPVIYLHTSPSTQSAKLTNAPRKQGASQRPDVSKSSSAAPIVIHDGSSGALNVGPDEAKESLLPYDVTPPPLARYDPQSPSALQALVTPLDEVYQDDLSEDHQTWSSEATLGENDTSLEERVNEWLQRHGDSLVRDYYDPSVNFLEALFKRVHHDCSPRWPPEDRDFFE